MNILKSSFKDNLKILRREKEIGQVELTKKIGVSKGIINLWKYGLTLSISRKCIPLDNMPAESFVRQQKISSVG